MKLLPPNVRFIKIFKLQPPTLLPQLPQYKINETYPMLSYLILTYSKLSYPIISYLILIYSMMSYLILSYPMLPYLILFYSILSEANAILSDTILSDNILSDTILSNAILSNIIPYDTILADTTILFCAFKCYHFPKVSFLSSCIPSQCSPVHTQSDSNVQSISLVSSRLIVGN